MALATAVPPTRTATQPSTPPMDCVPGGIQPAPHVPVAPAQTPATDRGRPSRAPERRPKLGPVGATHRTRAATPRPASAPAPVRLTRRGVVASWLVAAVSIAIAVFGLAQGLQPSAPSMVGTQSVVIQPGQTLWEVAKAVNPGVDPRVTVTAMRGENALDGAVLVPGSAVTVPKFGRH
jgi:hypothetical protein